MENWISEKVDSQERLLTHLLTYSLTHYHTAFLSHYPTISLSHIPFLIFIVLIQECSILEVSTARDIAY